MYGCIDFFRNIPTLSIFLSLTWKLYTFTKFKYRQHRIVIGKENQTLFRERDSFNKLQQFRYFMDNKILMLQ